LPEKVFYVRATDQNGNVLVSENISTLRNGFFELWLPRNLQIQLSIEGLGRKAIGRIETFDKSKTCITTVQLS